MAEWLFILAGRKRAAPVAQTTAAMCDRSAADGPKAVNPVMGSASSVPQQCYRQEYFLGEVMKDIPWVSQVCVGAGCVFTCDACVGPQMWDLHSGQLVRTFSGHTGRIMAMVFVEDHNNEPSIVTGSTDLTVQAWDLNTAQSRIVQTFTSKVLSLAYSKTVNATYLMVGTRHPTVLMVDFHTGKKMMGFKGLVSKGVEGEAHEKAIWDMTVDPTGRYLYTASKDTLIKMWDLRTGFLIETYDGHQDAVRNISLHEGVLFSAAADNITIEWSTSEPEATLQYFTSDAWVWCCLAAAGCLFVGTLEGEILEWKLAPQEAPAEKTDRSVAGCPSLAGKPSRRYHGHANAVRCLCYDSGFLFSGSLDGSTRQWDISTGCCVRTFTLPTSM